MYCCVDLQEAEAEPGGRSTLGHVIGWLRSVIGQAGNDSGSGVCLLLVVVGFLLTLFDPSIHLVQLASAAPCSAQRPVVDGAAVSCSAAAH